MAFKTFGLEANDWLMTWARLTSEAIFPIISCRVWTLTAHFQLFSFFSLSSLITELRRRWKWSEEVKVGIARKAYWVSCSLHTRWSLKIDNKAENINNLTWTRSSSRTRKPNTISRDSTALKPRAANRITKAAIFDLIPSNRLALRHFFLNR